MSHVGDGEDQKCIEYVRLKGQSILCPNRCHGYYRDDDRYEMRSYPMCAAHAAGYGHRVDETQVIEDRKKWVLAVDQSIIERMTQLAELLMENIDACESTPFLKIRT